MAWLHFRRYSSSTFDYFSSNWRNSVDFASFSRYLTLSEIDFAGIQTLVNNTLSIEEYLGPLLDYANSKIPELIRPQTPLFLGATAGVRSLDPKDRAWLISEIQNFFAKTEYYFEPDFARLLDGTEEAYYGWITVNYLHDLLNTSSASHKISTMGALGKTLIILLNITDLGGFSLQITFQTIEPPKNGSVSLVFNEELQYELYSHSFFGNLKILFHTFRFW
jgi:hypothetical protein